MNMRNAMEALGNVLLWINWHDVIPDINWNNTHTWL